MMHLEFRVSPGDPRAGQEVFRQRQVILMRLADLDPARGALGLILGPRALDLLRAPVSFLYATDVIGVLTPITESL